MSRHYVHERQIQCRADQAFAETYTMPNGDTVLAFCRITAEEYHREMMACSRQREDDPEDLLPLE